MPAPTPIARIGYSELLDAFEFVSFGPPLEHCAFIDPDTGAIYCLSSEMQTEEERPDDLETSDRYIQVPHKNDLTLGRDLALSFAAEEIPGEHETIAALFRKKGAYARFKGLLDARNLLERWYAFESRETEKALRLWCLENGIELIDEP
ncbi:MAG: UPF0158 family protein [Rhodocyclaceae bacterium]